MNRPRNRQSKPRGSAQGRGRGGSRGGRARSPRRPYPSSVPNIHQVIPGAQVSIVLKQDQPTGHEVQGVVADVLTRGDHPRGIKVRLQDGRVGRVQRMVTGDAAADISRPILSHDRKDDAQQGLPPSRTLADFLPDSSEDEYDAAIQESTRDQTGFSSANAVCPICGLFEGDEIAVSHHVESHLS